MNRAHGLRSCANLRPYPLRTPTNSPWSCLPRPRLEYPILHRFSANSCSQVSPLNRTPDHLSGARQNTPASAAPSRPLLAARTWFRDSWTVYGMLITRAAATLAVVIAWRVALKIPLPGVLDVRQIPIPDARGFFGDSAWNMGGSELTSMLVTGDAGARPSLM